MSPIYRSPQYHFDASSYAAEREERMIALLDEFYWKCFFMLRMNNIEGDYLEFGCGSNIRSFRLAYKYKMLEHSRLRLFAFDSFEGLPEPSGIDRGIHLDWQKGAMAVPLEVFHKVMGELGAQPDKDFTCVPGYYESTLDGRAPEAYGIVQAAMVMVDCDLYASAATCLKFVAPALVNGSIIAFDDWYCYKGRPDRGEQLAFSEFLRSNPQFSVTEFQDFGWHGKSFLVHIPSDD